MEKIFLIGEIDFFYGSRWCTRRVRRAVPEGCVSDSLPVDDKGAGEDTELKRAGLMCVNPALGILCDWNNYSATGASSATSSAGAAFGSSTLAGAASPFSLTTSNGITTVTSRWKRAVAS